MSFDLRVGDCMAPEAGLPALAATSVDAMVTDPPAGISFMGKAWDSDRGGRRPWIDWLASVMRECLRVLKPGAHGFVWALPRTSHWTATALEEAGFEIRDVLTHHFGTGFPKSLDVSKAIDAAAGAEREVLGPYRTPGEGQEMTSMQGWGRTDARRTAVVTAPATEAAKQWAGWGTALKPASEHWILVRKPFSGTVAANVQEHGTGALNIDACRIDFLNEEDRHETVDKNRHGDFGTGPRSAPNVYDKDVRDRTNYEARGRWPANLALSHSPLCADVCSPGCPVAELDRQSSQTVGTGPRKLNGADRPTVGKGAGFSVPAGAVIGDSGGASRFFYCAKPAASERNGGGHVKNTHPTVKPVALMRWLTRLITPPGGLVIDPFTGSGSTGVAVIEEGCRFLGWEQDADSAVVASARLSRARKQPVQLSLVGGAA